MTLISEEDKELAAKAVFLTALQSSLEACRKMKLGPSATLVGLFSSMTTVVQMLYKMGDDNAD